MTLDEQVYAELDRRLAPVDAARLAAYPGERAARQPVHTCYVPADAVVPGLARQWGTTALAALDEHGLPDLGLDPALVRRVIDEEVAGIGELENLDDARALFEQVALADDFPDFLTLPAYELID